MLSLISGVKWIKWVALATALSLLVAAYQIQLRNRYNEGYALAKSETQAEAQATRLIEIDAAVGAAKLRWKQAQESAVVVETKVQDVREVIRYVYRDIPAAAASTNCADLGPDFLRVFNAAATSGAGTSGDNTGDTSR